MHFRLSRGKVHFLSKAALLPISSRLPFLQLTPKVHCVKGKALPRQGTPESYLENLGKSQLYKQRQSFLWAKEFVMQVSVTSVQFSSSRSYFEPSLGKLAHFL
jgi:hypothetical protein